MTIESVATDIALDDLWQVYVTPRCVIVAVPAGTDPECVWPLLDAHSGDDWLIPAPDLDETGTIEYWSMVAP